VIVRFSIQLWVAHKCAALAERVGVLGAVVVHSKTCVRA